MTVLCVSGYISHVPAVDQIISDPPFIEQISHIVGRIISPIHDRYVFRGIYHMFIDQIRSDPPLIEQISHIVDISDPPFHDRYVFRGIYITCS